MIPFMDANSSNPLEASIARLRNETASDLEQRYSTERSGSGRDAILAEASDYSAALAETLVARYGWPEQSRCSKWIGGQRCDNFAMAGEPYGRCAIHGIGTRDRVAATQEP